MSKELVQRLREPMTLGFSLKLGDMSKEFQSQRDQAADLIERQGRIIEDIKGAFEKWECPRPINGRPDDFTIGQCLDAGECGCVAQVCRDVPEEGE